MHPPSLALTDVASRLLWGLLLGCVIGFERQWHQKMAGLKTNALVALGSAGFVTFATAAGAGNPSVISAQIVSGIGFLGAGVIMREGVNVHGLNTAATVWCSAMVGALSGFGMWQAGGIAALLVLATNLVLRPIANWQNTRVQSGNEIESAYTITLVTTEANAPHLRQFFLPCLHGLVVNGIASESRPDDQARLTVRVTSTSAVDDRIEAALATAAKDPAVLQTAWDVVRASPEA
jgi:putative Mg2+ transporter-C (MgtC) family protein